MALKPDRMQNQTADDIYWICNTVVERGGIASISTSASGGYPGDSANVCTYAASPSGAKPLGMLLYDVVSYDTNRLHDNWYKSGYQARSGMKVHINKGGWYNTNMIATGITPVGGDPAYLSANGKISNVDSGGAPRVGTFRSAKDATGFASVAIELL